MNMTQISQSTNKTGVEYFMELMEKAWGGEAKQTTKLKMYIAHQQYTAASRVKLLLQNNSLRHTLF